MTTLVLEAALKGTVLLLAAWGAAWLLRNSSADLRHRIWLAALGGMVLLLIPVRVPEAAQVAVVYTFSTGASSVAATPSALALWPTLWAIGFCILALRFLAGVGQLSLLTRRAEKTEYAGLRVSEAVSTPLTWGVFKPEILLPTYARKWSPEKRAIALAHERAHISRGDWLWQSLAQLVTAVFWFHPLVWFAAARLRQEAEQAADDAVLFAGAEPSSYAEQLLEVARLMVGAEQATGVAMVRRPALAARVSAILDATRVRRLAGMRWRVTIFTTALCVVPILAAFQSRPLETLPAPVVPVVGVPLLVKTKPRPVEIAQAAPAPKSIPAPSPTPAPAAEPYPIGGDVSAPVAVSKFEPEYPEAAKQARYQGEVLLSLVIDANGVPTEIKVARPLGLGLDEKAIEAVQKWRFKPGMKDGKPVSVKANISVGFHLQ